MNEEAAIEKGLSPGGEKVLARSQSLSSPQSLVEKYQT